MSKKIYTIEETKKIANSIRKQILGITLNSGGCYLAQACSSAELVAALYTQIMNLGPSTANFDPMPFPGVPSPENMDYQKGAAYHGDPTPENDRFFVSCCHYASVIYAALAAVERLTPNWVDKFNVDGWNMEMIGAEHSPGFENSAGSLGQTISIAGGTAHAKKMKGESGKIYCMLGDGELQEGQLWECIQTASYYKLDNFIIVIDVNGQQVEGATCDQMDMGSLEDKFTAFGAACQTCDGHDVQQIIDASKVDHKDKPLIIICNTRGTTGMPPLEKNWPLLHFVKINESDREVFEKIYNEL